MDRYWLITWTCYGTWLPGARQGFVGHVRDEQTWSSTILPGRRTTPMPAPEAYARAKMTGPPVRLNTAAAEAMIVQYGETCRIAGGSCTRPA